MRTFSETIDELARRGRGVRATADDPDVVVVFGSGPLDDPLRDDIRRHKRPLLLLAAVCEALAAVLGVGAPPHPPASPPAGAVRCAPRAFALTTRRRRRWASLHWDPAVTVGHRLTPATQAALRACLTRASRPGTAVEVGPDFLHADALALDHLDAVVAEVRRLVDADVAGCPSTLPPTRPPRRNRP